MQYNFGIWWDADLLRELLDGTTISDWNYTALGRVNLVYAPSGLTSNNGSKSNPSLVADIFGDWREEVIWRRSDNTALQIWTTTIPANNRIYTLMHDPIYRMAIAWQNVAYNQPPHPGFFLGFGMDDPPIPQIYTVQYVPGLAGDYNNNGQVDAADYSVWRDAVAAGLDTLTNRDPSKMNGEDLVGESDFLFWRDHFGEVLGGSGQAAYAPISSLAATTVSASPSAGEASLEERATVTPQFAAPTLAAAIRTVSENHRPSARILRRAKAAAVGESEQSLLLLLNRSARDSSDFSDTDEFDDPREAALSTVARDSLFAGGGLWESLPKLFCNYKSVKGT
jgi:rhamnogalacturonan endolyase